MKSVKFSALVAVAVIAASCAKEGTHSVDESNKVALEPMCIEASDESQTKTVLVGQSVNWTEGDEIAVYSNRNYTTGWPFQATDINGNTATFNGEVPAGTESFFAVYPPESVRSVNAEGVTVNIPADQTPAEGTFAEEHNITVAQGTKTPGVPSVGTITFNNVCSYVKFTVPAYVSDVNKVTITSGNAIAGDFSTASSSIVSNGTNSISMIGSFGAGKTFIFVIAPGTVSNFRIDITASNGNWTRTVSNGFTATAGIPKNLGTVDFKQLALTASANHVYDAANTLLGTDLNVDLHLDGFTNYASDLKFDVKKGGTTVRSYSSETVASSTVSLTSTAYADYPYLPQGDYTIEGSYTRPDGSSQPLSGTFTVAAPTFTVKALGMTSYSYYNNGNSPQANKCLPETIYDLGGSASISQTLLDKYSYTASYTLDGSNITAGDKADQSWGEHKITATYTFDGVTVTSPELVCYITGLPYKAVPPTNTGDHAWSATRGSTNIDWNSTNVQLNAARSTSGELVALIQSPSFHLPKDINISSSTLFILRSNSSRYETTLNMYIGGTSSFGKGSSETKETSFTQNSTGRLNTSKPYVEYEAYRPLWPTSITNYYAKVTNVELYYN